MIKPLVILCVLALASGVQAQSTAFTYQGQLNDGASVAQGQHDFRFRLFDAATGGTQVGPIQCVDNIQVSDGVFTATMDFGNQFASLSQRFLEIEVRRDSGLSCSNASGFVVLTPRQPIAPAPTASQAASAFSLAAPDGSPAKAVFVDNDGKVGIGTQTPTHSLHIATLGPTLALQDTNAGSQQVGYISYRDNANIERAWVGYGTPGSTAFSIVNARPSGHIALLPLSGGNVGIGTTSPASALDVRGNIKLGNSGQFFAPGAEENLRIVRGTVDFDGTIIRGSGFTAQKIDVGKYRVNFSTPFATVPTVIATSTRHAGDLQVGFAAIDEFAPPTVSQMTLVIKVFPANDYRDSRFEFIAVGVR